MEQLSNSCHSKFLSVCSYHLTYLDNKLKMARFSVWFRLDKICSLIYKNKLLEKEKIDITQFHHNLRKRVNMVKVLK